jgi:hypothetical protein
MKRNLSDSLKRDTDYDLYDAASLSSTRHRRQYEDNENILDDIIVQHPTQLTERQKMTIRVIRKIKYFVARRKFQVSLFPCMHKMESKQKKSDTQFKFESI